MGATSTIHVFDERRFREEIAGPLRALLAAPEGAETALRYAEYFRRLCTDGERELWGSNAEAWLDRFEYEFP